jgi:hypothetical protein
MKPIFGRKILSAETYFNRNYVTEEKIRRLLSAETMLPEKKKKKSIWLIWYTTVEVVVMVPFDLTSKGLVENVFGQKEVSFGRNNY